MVAIKHNNYYQSNNLLPYIALFTQSILIILYLIYLFSKIDGSLLVLNDHFLMISDYRPDYLSSQIVYDNFGLAFSISSQSILLDRFLYNILFRITNNFIFIQQIKLALTVLIYFNLSFYGVYHLSKQLKCNIGFCNVYVVFLFYTLNSFTTIFWNTGIFFSTQQTLAYSIIPLAFSLFYSSIVVPTNCKSSYLKLSIATFFISMVPYIAFIFMLVIIVFLIIYSFLNQQQLIHYIARSVKAVCCFLPLSFYNLPVLMQILGNINAQNSNHVANGGMAGALKGGLLNQILMRFWWPIYNVWEPRSILSFNDYLFSLPFILSSIALFGLIGVILIREKNKKPFVPYLCVLLFCLFFGKGPQEPFGSIFNFFLRHFPFWDIVRTPDNKFAIGTVFAVTVILLSSGFGKKSRYLLYLIIIAQAYPLISAEAIIGKNNNRYIDRLVKIPKEYFDLSDYLNKNNKRADSYVLPLPASGFDTYRYGEGNFRGHIGQDLLNQLNKMPFLYFSENCGMNREKYKDIKDSFKSYEKFKKFIENNPIKYVLFRKDANLFYKYAYFKFMLEKDYKTVFKNELFQLFLIDNNSKILTLPFSETGTMQYLVQNQDIIKSKTLSLYFNKNPYWKMIPVNQVMLKKLNEKNVIDKLVLNFIFVKMILANKTFEKIDDKYFNVWDTTKKVVSFGNSFSGSLILYELNSISVLSNFISLIALAIYSFSLILTKLITGHYGIIKKTNNACEKPIE